MAQRTRRTTLDENWKAKHQISMLVNKLRDHVDNSTIIHRLSTQVKAAEILSRKVIPDLKAIEHTGEMNVQVTKVTEVIVDHSGLTFPGYSSHCSPSRYKGAWGARLRQVSFLRMEIIKRSLTVPGLRVVCIREVQNTLKESSKRLIEDKLQAHGIGSGQGVEILTDQSGLLATAS